LFRRLFEDGTSDLFLSTKGGTPIDRVVEELSKERPIIAVLDFFVIHSAIWPGVRRSQLVHCDWF